MSPNSCTLPSFADVLRLIAEPQSKAAVTNISYCKLNADSIYNWWDLHPISSMQVSRKQMLGIVLSLNSSERGSSQHQHVRLALYLHAKRQ